MRPIPSHCARPSDPPNAVTPNAATPDHTTYAIETSSTSSGRRNSARNAGLACWSVQVSVAYSTSVASLSESKKGLRG
ncbi:hypothetical protein ACIBL5_36655 [Streptomyces sp. NPDC050516]|uniref:hypothetical protein n=1 Tax=Streptomyces sp. NPDC050516 TaxID=3365621 RepID=UPI0037A0ADAF